MCAEYIINNKLALAEAEATAMINLFSRHIWPTVNQVRKMAFGAVQEVSVAFVLRSHQ
jgi:hypothetical protein